MKTETLLQAINFVLGTPEAKKYIKKNEAPPDDFVIFRIAATVTNYQDSIISVLINFNERRNPNNYKEDAIIDIQGTDYSNFKIIKTSSMQIDP